MSWLWLIFSVMLRLRVVYALNGTLPGPFEEFLECKEFPQWSTCLTDGDEAAPVEQNDEHREQEILVELRTILVQSGIKEVVIFSDERAMILEELSCHEFDMSIFTLRPHYSVIIDCREEFELRPTMSSKRISPLMEPMMTFIILREWTGLPHRRPPPSTYAVLMRLPARYVLWSFIGGVSYKEIPCNRMSEIVLPNGFFGLGYRELNIGTIPYDPFIVVGGNSTHPTYDGYSVEILKILAEELKFRYRIISYGGNWGFMHENGTWTGSIRGLIDHDIDMQVSALTVTSQREQVIDFSYLIWEQTTSGLLLTEEQDQFTMFQPLHQYVWFTLVSAAIVAAFVAFGLETCHQFMGGYSLSWYSCWTDINEYTWYTLGAMFYQGGVCSPTFSPTRILLGSFWLCAIVVMIAYCSQLMSFLAVTQMTLPFTTLEEAVQAKDYDLRINTCSVYTQLFLDNPAYPGVWERAIGDPDATLCGVDMKAAVMDMFENNQKAVIVAMRGLLMDNAVKSGYCNWGFLDERIFKTGMAIGLPQHTPYKGHIDASIARLHESGIIERIKGQTVALVKEDVCEPESQAEASSLGLENVWPLFAIVGIGVLIALISLVMELLLIGAFKQQP